MTDFGWEYPPGVTGNEPQLTGGGEVTEQPVDEICDECSGDIMEELTYTSCIHYCVDCDWQEEIDMPL